MINSLTIVDLIINKTLSAEMAGLLWSAVDEKISFLTSAIYRNAGKSTVAKAVLSLRPENIPLHYVSDNPEVTEKLLGVEKHGGYLVVEEFSSMDIPGYLWAEEAKHVFDMAKNGYSLQGSIHADSPEHAVEELIQGVGLPDDSASIIQLVVYIEMQGSSAAQAVRRVSEVFEVHRVENGKPLGHLLYRWNKATDLFEMVEESHLFARNKESLRKRGEILGYLANTNKNTEEDIKKALKEFRGE